MSRLTRWLHLDEPVVSEDDRGELNDLRAMTTAATDRAQAQSVEANRLSRYVIDRTRRNHIAESLALMFRNERGA
jgi:hypothetical protein